MSNPIKRIWIFGATGFIGQALVKRLALNPRNLLYILFHRNRPFKTLESHSTFTGSLLKIDPTIFKRYPPDVVFHLARFRGGNMVLRSLASQKAYRANLRLAEILGRLEKPPVVIYVSGSLMYGPGITGMPVTESFPLKPVAFAKQYVRGELPWLQYQKAGNLDVRFARPGWIVGPSSWFREFFWKFYLENGKVPVYGDGSQMMSVVGLDDCAGLIELLSLKGTTGQNLNIFTLPPVSQKLFSEILAEKLKAGVVKIPIKQTARRYGKAAATALTASIPMATEHPEMYENFRPLHPDLYSMFDKILPLLENK